MQPAIRAASLAVDAHEGAPTSVSRGGRVPCFGFDRRAPRRNFERSPFLRASGLRHRVATTKISLRRRDDRRGKAGVAAALSLERLHAPKIGQGFLWNMDADLHYFAVDFANNVAFAGARLDLRRFALRFSR